MFKAQISDRGCEQVPQSVNLLCQVPCQDCQSLIPLLEGGYGLVVRCGHDLVVVYVLNEAIDHSEWRQDMKLDVALLSPPVENPWADTNLRQYSKRKRSQKIA